jgi:alkylhydroperoxidase family enzyme
MPKLIEYKDMAPHAKAIVEGIAQARGIAPADMKVAFAPGKLDPLTKELVYLAISITNQCDYCIASHGAMAPTRA